MKKHILIIDDESDICELLSFHLQNAGFKTDAFLNAFGLEKFLDENSVDLIIMDINLNAHSGKVAVENLRKMGYNEPVIFLTARSENSEKIAGLKLGDDYITKPFEMNELIARINAVLKRSSSEFEVLRSGEICLNLDQMSAFLKGEKLNLTKLEFRLLLALIKNQNMICSREFLGDEIWGGATEDKTINTAIKRLRTKLGKFGENIKSVAGVGYKIC